MITGIGASWGVKSCKIYRVKSNDSFQSFELGKQNQDTYHTFKAQNGSHERAMSHSITLGEQEHQPEKKRKKKQYYFYETTGSSSLFI